MIREMEDTIENILDPVDAKPFSQPQRGFNDWAECEDALKCYFNLAVTESVRRGMANARMLYPVMQEEVEWPWWFDWSLVHFSHQAFLLQSKKGYKFEVPAVYLERNPCYPNSFYLQEKIKYPNDSTDELVARLFQYHCEELCTPLKVEKPHFTEDECVKWLENKLLNPCTGRHIQENGPTYRDFEYAVKYYKL
jgi:hypothetical protein